MAVGLRDGSVSLPHVRYLAPLIRGREGGVIAGVIVLAVLMLLFFMYRSGCYPGQKHCIGCKKRVTDGEYKDLEHKGCLGYHDVVCKRRQKGGETCLAKWQSLERGSRA